MPRYSQRCTILFIVIIRLSCVGQVLEHDPYIGLNTYREPVLFSPAKMARQKLRSMYVIGYEPGYYDSTITRPRYVRHVKFDTAGRITLYAEVDSAYVFDREKENLFGKLRLWLGLNGNMIWRDTTWYFYDSEGHLDSSLQKTVDYWSDRGDYIMQASKFAYDTTGKLSKKIDQRKYYEAATETFSAPKSTRLYFYNGQARLDSVFDPDTGGGFKMSYYDSITAANCRTEGIFGGPQYFYNSAGQTDSVVRNMVEIPPDPVKSSLAGYLPLVALRKESTLYSYDSKGRISSKHFLDAIRRPKYLLRFIYNDKGLIQKKVYISADQEYVKERYIYEYY